jgi:hypothetical protein
VNYLVSHLKAELAAFAEHRHSARHLHAEDGAPDEWKKLGCYDMQIKMQIVTIQKKKIRNCRG